MKKISIIILSVLLFSAVFTACTNLEETVYSSVTAEKYNYTTDNLWQVVATVYRPIDYPSHGGYFCAQENSGNAICMPANASGWDDGGIYKRMHYHTWTSDQSHVNSIWTWMYQGALLCNDAINKIETGLVPAASDSDKKLAIAELRAARAYYYWLIMDNFGSAPLVRSTEETDLPTNTSRGEMFDFVTSELESCIPELSTAVGVDMRGRFNKYAAQALLAEVYLNAEVYTATPQWEKCISVCDDIINSHKYSLEDNYKDCFRDTDYKLRTTENILVIPYDEGRRTHAMAHYSWHGHMNKVRDVAFTPWGSGCACGVPQFIDTYDVDDSRLADTWLMGDLIRPDGTRPEGQYDKRGQYLSFTNELPDGIYVGEDQGYRMNKYEVSGGVGRTGVSADIPIYRYAHILLMKAEALLRSNKPGAGALVTSVRARAFKSNPSKATVTDAELAGNSCYQYGYVEDYKIVDKGDTTPIKYGRMLDELGWEFAWEFHTRRDLIRYGVYTTKSWLSHKPQGQYRTVFPIPLNAMKANPNLTQNEGY